MPYCSTSGTQLDPRGFRGAAQMDFWRTLRRIQTDAVPTWVLTNSLKKLKWNIVEIKNKHAVT